MAYTGFLADILPNLEEVMRSILVLVFVLNVLICLPFLKDGMSVCKSSFGSRKGWYRLLDCHGSFDLALYWLKEPELKSGAWWELDPGI